MNGDEPRMAAAAMAMASPGLDDCRYFDQLLSWRKEHPKSLALLANQTRHERATAAQHGPRKRKVWDLIVFGHELAMLRLHMQQLKHVVAGFLVTESTTCFQQSKTKPAVLTEAIASGTLPAGLAAMTKEVKIVELADAIRGGHCRNETLPMVHPKARRIMPAPKYSTRCFQAYQRWVLLELLERHAAPGDLALVADVDEIANPSFVELAALCAPFPPGLQPYRDVGMIIVQARQHKFGTHCDSGDTWTDGPRLYAVDWVLDYRKRKVMEFDQLRNQMGLSTSNPSPIVARASAAESHPALLSSLPWNYDSHLSDTIHTFRPQLW